MNLGQPKATFRKYNEGLVLTYFTISQEVGQSQNWTFQAWNALIPLLELPKACENTFDEQSPPSEESKPAIN